MLGFNRIQHVSSFSVYDNFKAWFSLQRKHKRKLPFYGCVYACANKSVMLTLAFTASENQA